MKSVLIVIPVFRRFKLTKIMLDHLANSTLPMTDLLGAKVGVAVIGDDDNMQVAEQHNFHCKYSPNILGAKYNDGHQMAVELGYDFSLQANSDQVHSPQLLKAITESPNDAMIRTTAITLVHGSGKKSLSYRNPVWAMKAYPTDLLRTVPRPCEEDIMSMCDTSTHLGVGERHPDASTVTVDCGVFQSVQFESGFQITEWRNWVRMAARVGSTEMPVPWLELGEEYGEPLIGTMTEFYGVGP